MTSPLNYFLGVSSTRTNSGIFLSQAKYVTKILERAHMLNYNPCRTPVDTEKKLGPDGSPVTDPTLYRSLDIELDAPLLVALLLAIVYSSETTCCHGLLNDRTPCLAQVLKLSIEGLRMPLPRLHGFAIFFVSYTLLSVQPL
ncbi:ribonuclease H-like domain-containing protein [Tanacetum coccineum]